MARIVEVLAKRPSFPWRAELVEYYQDGSAHIIDQKKIDGLVGRFEKELRNKGLSFTSPRQLQDLAMTEPKCMAGFNSDIFRWANGK